MFKKIGTLNCVCLCQVFGLLQTDEVIITPERENHIKSRHPEDYALFEKFAKIIITSPDMIIKDEKHIGTIFLIKALEDTNLSIIIRVALETDTPGYQNSVMTFYRIRDKNLKKLVRKNQILYRIK